ncbi:hypothetical protein S40293_10331, partial [Stachybotrys chartarum IBT 40293]
TRFEPLRIPYRDLVVLPLPPTPLELFQRFLPEQTVQQWVDYTNNPDNYPEDRQGQWKPTSVGEIYIWVAVLIYMSLHIEKRYQDYWRAPTMTTTDETVYQNIPVHPIIQYMTYERFCDIKRRIRIDDPDTIAHGLPRPYSQVAEWSDSLIPGRALGPVGRLQRRKKKPQDDPYDVNPTQAVVVALLETLPRNTYHVFLDNLFSSPQLFRRLRQLHLGIGATGTARTNAGLYERLIKAKDDDRKGHKMWPWGQLQSWPTEDNLVNQIGWKDNALVVFLSTVYSGTETVDKLRRRPTSLAPYSGPIRQEFGTEAVKTLSLPSVAADYNDYMGAVDIADQLRAYINDGSHRQKRGP